MAKRIIFNPLTCKFDYIDIADLSTYATIAYADSLLPKLGNMWGTDFIAITGNAVTAQAYTNQWFDFYSFQASPALNNVIESTFCCTAGNYSFDILCIKFPNAGIIKIIIDGTDVATGIDLYTATGAGIPNTRSVFTVNGLAVGHHTLQVQCTGKNVSATSPYYYMPITKISFTKV